MALSNANFSEAAQQVTYRNGPRPMHDYLLLNASEAPDQAAYIFYGREVTWGELAESTRRLAGFLRASGIGKGDHVGLYLQNCPQYVIAHYAIQMLGAVITPLNPQYKAAEVEYQLNNAEARAVICGTDLYPMVDAVRTRLDNLALVVTTRYADYLPHEPTLPVPEDMAGAQATPEGTTDLVVAIEQSRPIDKPESVDFENDIALMTFTSGTTGRPKGAMLPVGAATFKTAALFQANGLDQATTSLAIAPFCHIAGMCLGVYAGVYGRWTTVILPRFDPETTVKAIETYKVDMWYSIAPMNRAILGLPDIQSRNLTSLRFNPATSFGIPVTESLSDEWKKLTGCQMHEASYGLSETHTMDTYMPRDAIRWGSCGKPMPGNDIRIINLKTGEEQPAGESGEIIVGNPYVFKGYWQRLDATDETLRNGWVYTGDVGYFDDDHYLFFTGRIKEMIKSSGYSVFPEDVEALMLNHPAIAQSAAVGVPDENRGESVKLFVVLKPDYEGRITEQEIIDWAKENMAAYKYPRYVEFRDSLPATGAGKVLRRLLKED
ncbi:long-chain acyl-CoA synthetase [Marinobacter daqiaonensis]|uniref:Long-chain acyl-CoA synthetase n=1 Tax=Marinobacter daqiaonensis TaxID=650891 RepID=A0A1I6H0R2_9GAMM|nr:AMP-binding protein [Marinobacter daqiaonensis]SFR48035.1 long-chain acyl-CoA synthetase [Marinobacter daqiaonensis]